MYKTMEEDVFDFLDKGRDEVGLESGMIGEMRVFIEEAAKELERLEAV